MCRRAVQICARSLAQLKELPRVRTEVQAVTILGSRTGVELSPKGFERGDVAPKTRTYGAREDDAKRGEMEAALAMLEFLAPTKDAHPRMWSFVKYLAQRGCAKKGGKWRRTRCPVYKVQSAALCSELNSTPSISECAWASDGEIKERACKLVTYYEQGRQRPPVEAPLGAKQYSI